MDLAAQHVLLEVGAITYMVRVLFNVTLTIRHLLNWLNLPLLAGFYLPNGKYIETKSIKNRSESDSSNIIFLSLVGY